MTTAMTLKLFRLGDYIEIAIEIGSGIEFLCVQAKGCFDFDSDPDFDLDMNNLCFS